MIFTAPREPNVNGRTPIGWSLIGQQGFPAITVPYGAIDIIGAGQFFYGNQVLQARYEMPNGRGGQVCLEGVACGPIGPSQPYCAWAAGSSPSGRAS